MWNLCKKFTFLLMVAALLTSFSPARLQAAGEEILCSTFPVYLFTKNIIRGRENYKLGLLVNSAQGCPHDYSPTPAALEQLSRADILVINGLGLETFLPEIMRIVKADLKIVDASGGPGDQEKKIVLNINETAQLDHDPAGPNPHIFASPDTAADMVRNISEGLSLIDPEGAILYRQNAAALARHLEALAAAYKSAGEILGHPRIMISRGIFYYMARDMGLEIVASLKEAGGVKPSAAQLAALAQKALEEKVQAIWVDPEGNISMAQILGGVAKIPVVVIDPVAAGPLDAPLDYYQKVMLTNLEVIVKALSPAPELTPTKK